MDIERNLMNLEGSIEYQYVGNEFGEESEACMVNFVGKAGPGPWQEQGQG